MDLEHKYGDDGAQALYLWRFAGASFGLERRFWWTLLGALLTGAVTALGAVLFNVVVERAEDATWLTDALERGLRRAARSFSFCTGRIKSCPRRASRRDESRRRHALDARRGKILV
mgnify:CR=1 FL=1